MREDEYKIRLGMLLGREEYKALSPLQRLFIREFMDYAWASEEKSESRESVAVLCRSWGWPERDVELICQLGVPDLPGVFSTSLDVSTLEDVFVSPLLEEQRIAFQEWQRCQLEEIRRKRQSQARFTALGRCKAKKEDPRVLYLEPKNRNLEEYEGWLPTRKFEINGQAYNVTESVYREFQKAFPRKDINEEMHQIFRWLARNPNKRKPLSGMNEFIHRWISTEWDRATNDSGIESAINDVFAELASEGSYD